MISAVAKARASRLHLDKLGVKLRAAAARPLLQGVFVVVGYGIALVTASVSQAGRVIPLAQDECFDDWCIAAVDARVTNPGTAASTDRRLAVTVRISNHGRGRAQAEPDAVVYLRDGQGRRLDPVAASSTAPSIGDRVPAGESREIAVAFDVPQGFAVDGLVKVRRSNFSGVVLIGGPSSLFHKPTLHALGMLPF